MNKPASIRGKRAAVAIALAACAASVAIGQSTGSDVTNTRHNLTASGPGPIKTTHSGESCIFCHTPHAANPIAPLWNRSESGSFYITYESSTLVAAVGQPTGSSRLCLSCHDGTIAINQTYNPLNNTGDGSIYISSADRGFIGTDLSDDHPISFTYDSSLATTKGEMRDPSMLPHDLPLDHNQQMQCTTCHDPHDDSRGKFLRMGNIASAMCRTCHELTDWNLSAHAVSTATLATATYERWDNLPNATTVHEAACESCHRPHSAGGRQRLLRHEAEENNCLNCHDGGVASNIAADFAKISVHRVSTYTGIHDPTEDPTTMREHVECVDCHDPHRTGAAGAATPPQIPPALFGASGMSSTGAVLTEATHEYQVCYKCHSIRNFAQPVVTRHLGDDNIASEFSPSNASFHPVEVQGRNADVPSLVQGLSTSTIVYCSSCHRSDNPTGPRGPHGSLYRPLLAANYATTNGTFESPQEYAMCYSCHNRDSILANESFTSHRKHIVDLRTPCSACHDPHGVAVNPHLINFDTAIVSPTSTGVGPTFTDLGARRGSCTLTCHGATTTIEHVNTSY